jgi:hypothetical protein
MQALEWLSRLPHWEIWLPVVIGMIVGGLSIVAFKAVTRGPQLKGAPRPEKKADYDPYERGSMSEQRRSLRRSGNPVEIYVAPEQSNEPAWRGWVVDRSMGGLCISIADEFKAGTILRVMPVNVTAMTPWVDIEVVYCRRANDGHEVGCKFVKQPPWGILLLFG